MQINPVGIASQNGGNQPVANRTDEPKKKEEIKISGNATLTNPGVVSPSLNQTLSLSATPGDKSPYTFLPYLILSISGTAKSFSIESSYFNNNLHEKQGWEKDYIQSGNSMSTFVSQKDIKDDWIMGEVEADLMLAKIDSLGALSISTYYQFENQNLATRYVSWAEFVIRGLITGRSNSVEIKRSTPGLGASVWFEFAKNMFLKYQIGFQGYEVFRVDYDGRINPYSSTAGEISKSSPFLSGIAVRHKIALATPPSFPGLYGDWGVSYEQEGPVKQVFINFTMGGSVSLK